MKRCSFRNLTIFFFLIGVSLRLLHAQNLDSLIDHSLHFARQQLVKTVVDLSDTMTYPYRTWEEGTYYDEGKWRTSNAGSWVSGWFPGCLWYMYEWTLDDIWKRWAESWTASLEKAKYYTRTHDVGFIIFCSFGNGYRIIGDKYYHDIIIEAADSLAMRFNTTIGCITAKDSYEGLWLMIDTMMNLELLLWASRNGGKPEYSDMVISHALKTKEDLIRDDGSTYQDAYYDPVTGDILKQGNHQGYADSSTWARGHAWGLYGFTMVYRYTGDIRFLEIAKELADYFIDNLPADHVPYWDFDSPDTLKDASAAAIAASGLLELSTLVPGEEAREKYWNAALNILTSLCSPAYLAEGTNSSGILLHGIQNYNETKGVDVSLIYADYYFVESLLRYLAITRINTVFENQNHSVSTSIQLLQNYPNPFNESTRIIYSILKSDFISLIVYDILGREIQTLVSEFQGAGTYSLDFDASRFSSGFYFYTLQIGNFVQTKKMLLLQ